MKLKPPVCILPKCKSPAGGLLCTAHWEPLPRELKQQLLDEKRAIERAGGKRITPLMTRLVLKAERLTASPDRPHNRAEP